MTHKERAQTLGLYKLLALVALFVTGSLNAAPITVTALAHNDTPKHLNANHLPYANPNANQGGVLSMAANGSFDHFNPFIDKGAAATYLTLNYESLMQQSLDEPFSMYPLLAESVTYDPKDASWVEYNLNPKARFQNGAPVLATDVVFTFENLLSKGAIFYRNYLAAIKEVKAVGKHKVRFEFQDASNTEIRMIVAQIPIGSQAELKDTFDKVSLAKPAGSGPYKVGRFQAGRSLEYVRDPDYWGNELMINKGAYNFERIVFKYYRSSEVAFEGFKAGQYRLRVENKARNWAVNYNFPAVKQGLVTKIGVPSFRPTVMQGFVFNTRKPLFADLKVRKALSLAYDFNWMNRTLFFDQYKQLTSFFESSELAKQPRMSEQEKNILRPLLPLLGADQRAELLSKSKPPQSNGDGFNRLRLLEARSLLLAAGFSYKNGHLHDSSGAPASIEILNYSSDLNRIILPYVQNLKRLGFEVTIRVVDVPQFIERTRQFDYDMILTQYPQSLSPGQEQRDYWGSAAADMPGSRNYAGIRSKAVDLLAEQIATAKDRQTLVATTRVLDRVLLSGHYVLPTYGTNVDRVAYWSGLVPPKVFPKYDLGLIYWSSSAKGAAKANAYIRGN